MNGSESAVRLNTLAKPSSVETQSFNGYAGMSTPANTAQRHVRKSTRENHDNRPVGNGSSKAGRAGER